MAYSRTSFQLKMFFSIFIESKLPHAVLTRNIVECCYYHCFFSFEDISEALILSSFPLKEKPLELLEYQSCETLYMRVDLNK